jgi:hypothetical protein
MLLRLEGKIRLLNRSDSGDKSISNGAIVAVVRIIELANIGMIGIKKLDLFPGKFKDGRPLVNK